MLALQSSLETIEKHIRIFELKVDAAHEILNASSQDSRLASALVKDLEKQLAGQRTEHAQLTSQFCVAVQEEKDAWNASRAQKVSLEV